MARGTHLVRQHLEMLNWKILEEYSDLIGEMIRGQAGVYALYKSERLYYVGLAVNLMRRLNQHRKDRHGGRWNHFSVYLMKPGEKIKELESLLLRIANPQGNRMSGRLKAAENLNAALRLRMKQRHDEKLARMLGKSARARGGRRKQSSRPSARTKASARELPLAGVARRAKRLRGYYKGYYYFATLYRNGEIDYAGERHASATGAARAIVQRRVDGMHFWSIREASGEWVRLRQHVC